MVSPAFILHGIKWYIYKMTKIVSQSMPAKATFCLVWELSNVDHSSKTELVADQDPPDHGGVA